MEPSNEPTSRGSGPSYRARERGKVFVLVSVGSIEEVILKYIISKSYALTDSTESPAATIFFFLVPVTSKTQR